MTLVDTSSWIHSLRPEGDASVRRRVEALVRSGDACWCPIVRLELWNGARGEHEKRVLKDLDDRLQELEIGPGIWESACDLARKARGGGLTIPATDILIAACARRHGAGIEHADEHFDMLAKV
jgi:predicted nucleic acid-binding protein